MTELLLRVAFKNFTGTPQCDCTIFHTTCDYTLIVKLVDPVK